MISSESSGLLKKLLLAYREIRCQGLFLSARWFVVSNIASDGINLIVLPDRESAEYCCADLYNILEGDNIFFLPASGKGVERSNYKSSICVQRTTAISQIIDKKDNISFIVSYPEALDEKIPSRNIIDNSIFKLKRGDERSHDEIIRNLGENGFERVDFVAAPGQYAIRGSLIDIFSFSNNYPYRISFWGNEIEKINFFDCNSQLSKGEVDEVEIISGSLSSGDSSEQTISEILPQNTLVWFDDSDMYSEKEFFKEFIRFRHVFLNSPIKESKSQKVEFHITPQPEFNKNFEILTSEINRRIEGGYRVLIYGENRSQLDKLKTIIRENGGRIPEFIYGKNIHQGFIDSDDKLCCFSEHEIFERFHRVSIRKSVEKTEQLTINDINSFNIGDYVVHIDHGVGVFGGLVRMKDDRGRMHEVVKITYRDGDVVFVSVHSLHKISRFRSRDGETPKINKLGSRTWVTLKNNAKSKVKDIAKDLIKLYARRKASNGFSFSPDTYLQDELESSFMYEDTPDQESATKAVKHDMEDNCPMDRLVCGDVGFGKTEIALRAAFKAVSDNKQVAVLVPTTILSLQHYTTFKQRLSNFPCTVDYVSRLRSSKEITEIKKDLKEGKIDILIGTHKILGSGFEFKDLGLLIIDEEQKFGVSAKEKLREIKSSVDTLTLTATPIPRTLQFSLLGARDLSIINTPPPNRIPVQTEIILFDEKEIKSIINYELNRGGQLFFLHNKVEQLSSIHDILHRLVPDMRICIAHGQMEAGKLEDVMLDFIRGEYDCMLCTTLIENGLDIPNANTIIINQAQNFGLSDLHQLRGRVGRSNRKAFCYLIVPPLVSITEDARRRLKAIEEFSDLGSGFNIAMQDLDIRGAGNLLGAEQSGFIMEMGFETYQKILSEAMEELGVETGIVHKNAQGGFIEECTVETDQQAMIPDEYMDVTAEKIRIYRQLDSMTGDKALDIYKKQLADRFGDIPAELDNLFYVVKIRNLGASLGFEKIIVKNGLLIGFFISNQMSPYFQSEIFECVIEKVNIHANVFTFKQSEGKLKIIAREIESLEKAYSTLSKLKKS